MRCRPVVASRTASLGTLSTIYIVISIMRESQAPLSHFFALSVQIPRSGPCINDWSAPAPSFRPATVAPGPLVSALGRSGRPRTRSRRPATAPRPCLDRSCGTPRCRLQPPLTCARQPTCAPTARRRRVGERPRMTRCRCRGARGRPPSAPGPRGAMPVPGAWLRHSVRARSAPRCCPRTGPSAAWGGISRRPAAAPTPASRPPARPYAAPIGPCGHGSAPLSGLLRPPSRKSAPLERPRVARSAPSPRPGSPAQRLRRGDQALHGVLPVRLHGRAAPISALQVPAQGCVDVHERLGAARQPLSSPPSAPISASMCLRRRVSDRSGGPRHPSLPAGRSAQGPPAGTPPPPRSVPGPRSARGLPLPRACV